MCIGKAINEQTSLDEKMPQDCSCQENTKKTENCILPKLDNSLVL